MALFEYGKFKSAAGLNLNWKINCDALTDEDWECIAKIVAELVDDPFKAVYGVPRGGLKFAEKLRPYCTRTAETILVVDDVWTTGKSMKDFMRSNNLNVMDGVHCVALFSRDCNLPWYVTSVFEVDSGLQV